jgi:uncharacterized membrane protein
MTTIEPSAAAPGRSLPPWLAVLGLAALALPICLPLATGRQLSGHDATVYLPRVVEFYENLRHGVLLPRWAPDLSSGQGQPLFLFAPPLFYYLASLAHAAGLATPAAINAACAGLVLAAAASSFLLGRLWHGAAGGLLAAAAYLYAPYFETDLFVRAALAEFSAFPFYPLALYGFARAARGDGTAFLVLGAAAHAAVLFAHPPSALLFTALLAAFCAANAWRARSWRTLAAQGAGLALGLGLAACVWLPAVAEARYAQMERVLAGYYQYANHFVAPWQLLSSRWGYGLSVPGDGDGMSFALGWSHLALIAVVAALARRRPEVAARGRLLFFAAAAALGSFLMLPQSDWAWRLLPPLSYVVFPWRLLAPVALCLALLAAPLAALLPGPPAWRQAGVAAALLLLVLPNLAHARPEDRHAVRAADWTPAAIARHGVKVTTADEYRPRWATETPRFRADPVRALAGRVELRGVERTPVCWRLDVAARTAARLEAALLYFPGWTLEREGDGALPIAIAPGTGLVRFRLPPGEHRLRLHFAATAARRWGDAASGANALLALGVLAGQLSFRMGRGGPGGPAAARRPPAGRRARGVPGG